MANTVFQTYVEKLSRVGHTSKKVPTFNTGDIPGPAVLTRQEAQSALPPSFIPLASVDEAKEFGGFPNSEFESGQLDNDLLPIPQAFSREVTPSPQPYSAQICSALRAYIYGNSTLVRSYKGILNALRFPMLLTLYEADEVTIAKDHPLIIKDDGHGQPMALLFRKVSVEPGGQIVWEGATGSMYCEELIYQQPTAGVNLAELLANGANGTDGQNFVSVGAKGDDGGNGGSPDKSGDGDNGERGKDNKNSCAQRATDGVKGGDGVDGGNGVDGVHGGDGEEVNVSVDTLSGTVYVGSSGGPGGKGGKGGKGGDGGKGGNGGAASNHCGAGAGKDGGKGGNGGKGGKGGNGGNGRNVYITFKNGSPSFHLQQSVAAGGTGGEGGVGGAGGGGGSNGGGPGEKGKTEDKADNGVTGAPGQVFINGKALV